MRKYYLIGLISFLILFLSGCAKHPGLSQKSKIDPTLPKVEQIRVIADITSVAFEWDPVYNERVKGYYLYRGESGSKLKRVAVIEDRFSSHYVDKELKPNTTYFYKMSTYDDKGNESFPSDTIKVKTLPLIESVSFIEAISHLPRRVKIIWRPHPNPRVKEYIIERSEQDNPEWKEIAVVKNRLQAEYIDKNLKDNHIYFYRIRVRTFDGIVSSPSKVVKAFTKPRPKMVKGLKATKDLPKKIVLTWEPNSEPDIDHYNIYRSPFSYGFIIVHAKVKGTKYVDLIGEDGVKRFYKVTAVDKDGLESFKQDIPVMGTTLPKPQAPIIVSTNITPDGVVIKWRKSDDRAVSYIVLKKEKQNILDTKEYKYTNIKTNSFIDRSIVPGVKYIYTVYSVDKFGIVSKPSEKIEVNIKK
ncbi:fibronectin type III domain-containing protein [Nitrosophilus kaiyonis]|uniref:fibronectin type III domain-containing protein n=1 Tax=Nitrosophilus kaiyonis TaxID=2930200 RepID=UPI0024926F73|nr:hypothetical protein [Nitrosophilus kaiyonis]